MNAKPVNLRQWRKRRRRDEAKAEADTNAARHGQSAAARRLHSAREEQAARALAATRSTTRMPKTSDV